MRDFPIHVEFEVTNHCNMACIMCPHKQMTRKKGYMSKEIFRKAVDECEGKVETSYLHQIGEPLLHPHIISMIDYAESKGIKTSLSTNCMLLDKEMADKLLNSKLSEITLCLDAITPAKYHSIRRGSNYDLVKRNIDRFIDMRSWYRTDMWVQVQLIEMQENASEVNKFIKEYQSIIGEFGEVLIKGYSTFAGATQKGEAPPPRRFTCGKLKTHMTIQWNGDVVICCRDYDGITVVGNVGKQSIKDIWHSPLYNKYRDALHNQRFNEIPLCKDC